MFDTITPDVLFFFDRKSRELALYECLASALLARYPATELRVKKTQIGFYDPGLYCCASMTPVRRKAERPDPFLTVTFSSDAPIGSPRLICVPVSRDRFTHHAVLGSPEDIDDGLLAWLAASHDLGRHF